MSGRSSPFDPVVLTDLVLKDDPLAFYLERMKQLEPPLPQPTGYYDWSAAMPLTPGTPVPEPTVQRKEPQPMSANLVRVATLPKPLPVKTSLDEQLAQDAAAKLGYGPMAEEIQSKTAEARLLAALRELDIKPFTHASVAAYKAEKRATAEREHRFYSYVSWRATELSKYKKAVPSYVLHTALQVHSKMPDAKFMVDEMITESRVPDPFLFVQIGTKTRYYLDVWDEPTFKGERQV